MTEHASQEITIEAKPGRVLEAVLELDQYPQWIPEIEKVSVYERDERGRAITAEFISRAMGQTITHVYRFHYENYPQTITWTLESGNMVSSLKGTNELMESTPTKTTVTYTLALDMAVALPGFMKRKATEKIVSSALANLKVWCEQRP